MTVVRGAGVRVLMISQYSDYLQVWATLQAGARGYLIKDDDGEKLAEAIRLVHAGGIAMTPELAFVITLRPPLLTDREHQAVLLRSRGCTFRAIGYRMGVAEATVRTYLQRASDKFAAASNGDGETVAIIPSIDRPAGIENVLRSFAYGP